MVMTAKGKHRKAKAHDVELAIAVAAAVPMSAIIALTRSSLSRMQITGSTAMWHRRRATRLYSPRMVVLRSAFP